MNAKHTPTPWVVDETPDAQDQFSISGSVDLSDNFSDSYYPRYETIAKFHSNVNHKNNTYTTPEKELANARHIVHCVNLHDELVECLRRLRMHCTDKYDAKQIDDLLLKAKGE